MREILFRAKHIHPLKENRHPDERWIEGYLSDEKHINSPKLGGEFLIDPKTVCQYTGLTDKNGRKIFEGDILKGFQYPFFFDGDFNYFAEVCWFDNCKGFGVYTFKNPEAIIRGISEGNTESFEDFSSSDWEVIGNVYDNPELLEENHAEGD